MAASRRLFREAPVIKGGARSKKAESKPTPPRKPSTSMPCPVCSYPIRSDEDYEAD